MTDTTDPIDQLKANTYAQLETMTEPQAEAIADILELALEMVAAKDAEIAAAMIRLGALGLAPKLDANVVEVITSLCAVTDQRGDGIPTHRVNPDGPVAVAVIERQTATIAKMREAFEAIKALPGELNMSNYGDDDVAELNASFIEGFNIAAQALEETSQ